MSDAENLDLGDYIRTTFVMDRLMESVNRLLKPKARKTGTRSTLRSSLFARGKRDYRLPVRIYPIEAA